MALATMVMTPMAEEEDGAGDDGDDADGPVEAADDGEGAGRLDGHLARAMRPEAEGDVVHPAQELGGRAVAGGGDGEAVHAVAIAGERLQVVEVQPDAVLVAGDVARIGAAAYEGGDAHGVAGRIGARAELDEVADAEAGVGGQSLVDRHRAVRGRSGGRAPAARRLDRDRRRERGDESEERGEEHRARRAAGGTGWRRTDVPPGRPVP
jgi:hypothetical protein